jgi:hypothetical protein
VSTSRVFCLFGRLTTTLSQSETQWLSSSRRCPLSCLLSASVLDSPNLLTGPVREAVYRVLCRYVVLSNHQKIFIYAHAAFSKQAVPASSYESGRADMDVDDAIITVSRRAHVSSSRGEGGAAMDVDDDGTAESRTLLSSLLIGRVFIHGNTRRCANNDCLFNFSIRFS